MFLRAVVPSHDTFSSPRGGNDESSGEEGAEVAPADAEEAARETTDKTTKNGTEILSKPILHLGLMDKVEKMVPIMHEAGNVSSPHKSIVGVAAENNENTE